jgi:gluconate 2-dehydrogenase gamma chain
MSDEMRDAGDESDRGDADAREDARDEVPPPGMSRRRALQVLGAVPLVGALALGAQQSQTGTRQTHEAPNQPARDTRRPPQSPKKATFLTQRERRTARVLADDIIPADDRSGSASEAGVVDFMDFNLAHQDTSPETRVAWRGGFRWLDTESRRRFGVAYAAATAAQRRQILDDISFPNGVPAGVPNGGVSPQLRYGAAFFAQFRDMTAAGFFSSAEGWKDLQYQGHVAVREWNGCPQAALDKLGVRYDEPRQGGR